MFGTDIDMFKQAIEAVRKKTKLPIVPKLAPDVSDVRQYARAAESCGADAISLINSVPAMRIDVETRKPMISNITGGLTGPAIRPIAVRLVWQAAAAVDIPVIGIGGISCAEDALQFIIAGASAVQIGTANFTNPATANEVTAGLASYLERHELPSVADLVGTVEV